MTQALTKPTFFSLRKAAGNLFHDIIYFYENKFFSGIKYFQNNYSAHFRDRNFCSIKFADRKYVALKNQNPPTSSLMDGP